jgi:Tfp pilus assembly protein PilF
MLIWDYKIDIKLFFLIGLILIAATFMSMGIKVIGVIFKIPYIITQSLIGYKKRNLNRTVMESYSNYLTSDIDSAKRGLSKIDLGNLEPELIDHVNLLNALCNTDFDKNMYLLERLINNRDFYDYVAKVFAYRLYEQKHYAQSLQYAELVRIVTNKDPKFIRLLVKLYAKLEMWEKFAVYMERYSDVLIKATALPASEISSDYVKVAKVCLANGNDSKAQDFLKQALEYDPINMEALETLCRVNMINGNAVSNLRILEHAFSISPSFIIFELYIESSDIDSKEAYKIFEDLVQDVLQHKEVFFAIAAWCGLIDEIEILQKRSEVI